MIKDIALKFKNFVKPKVTSKFIDLSLDGSDNIVLNMSVIDDDNNIIAVGYGISSDNYRYALIIKLNDKLDMVGHSEIKVDRTDVVLSGITFGHNGIYLCCGHYDSKAYIAEFSVDLCLTRSYTYSSPHNTSSFSAIATDGNHNIICVGGVNNYGLVVQCNNGLHLVEHMVYASSKSDLTYFTDVVVSSSLHKTCVGWVCKFNEAAGGSTPVVVDFNKTSDTLPTCSSSERTIDQLHGSLLSVDKYHRSYVAVGWYRDDDKFHPLVTSFDIGDGKPNTAPVIHRNTAHVNNLILKSATVDRYGHIICVGDNNDVGALMIFDRDMTLVRNQYCRHDGGCTLNHVVTTTEDNHKSVQFTKGQAIICVGTVTIDNKSKGLIVRYDEGDDRTTLSL